MAEGSRNESEVEVRDSGVGPVLCVNHAAARVNRAYREAEALFRRGEYGRAVERYGRLRREHGSKYWPVLYEACALKEMQRWGAVVELLDEFASEMQQPGNRYIRMMAESPLLLMRKGEALVMLDRCGEALACLVRADEAGERSRRERPQMSHPRNAEVLYWKALALERLGRTEEALEAAEMSLQVNPMGACEWYNRHGMHSVIVRQHLVLTLHSRLCRTLRGVRPAQPSGTEWVLRELNRTALLYSDTPADPDLAVRCAGLFCILGVPEAALVILARTEELVPTHADLEDAVARGASFEDARGMFRRICEVSDKVTNYHGAVLRHIRRNTRGRVGSGRG